MHEEDLALLRWWGQRGRPSPPEGHISLSDPSIGSVTASPLRCAGDGKLEARRG